MTEKISVIIPVLNRGPYISRAIKSVLNQTMQDFEIIVIDGRSDDDGPKIVKEFNDPRISLVIQKGKGVSNARNEAVNIANCDYISFLDADDEFLPNHLKTIQRLIVKYPDSGMYATAYKIHTNSGKIISADYKSIPNPPWEGLLPNYFKSGALGFGPVLCSVVVIPKKFFYQMGGFPEGYWFGEDIDLFGKIALKYQVAFSWEFGAIYHWDASNRACDRKRPLDYIEPFVNTARTNLMRGDVPLELIKSLNEYISKFEIRRAARNVAAGRSDTALNILKQCNTTWSLNKKMKWLILASLPPPLISLYKKYTQSNRNSPESPK
jgi:glycosyltransferase involved in cell wall biosynthesis